MHTRARAIMSTTLESLYAAGSADVVVAFDTGADHGPRLKHMAAEIAEGHTLGLCVGMCTYMRVAIVIMLDELG